jgi:hypothetical protein
VSPRFLDSPEIGGSFLVMDEKKETEELLSSIRAIRDAWDEALESANSLYYMVVNGEDAAAAKLNLREALIKARGEYIKFPPLFDTQPK